MKKQKIHVKITMAVLTFAMIFRLSLILSLTASAATFGDLGACVVAANFCQRGRNYKRP